MPTCGDFGGRTAAGKPCRRPVDEGRCGQHDEPGPVPSPAEAPRKIVADESDPVKTPVDWDKAVSAAYLRMIGLSQENAAKGAGVGERSIVRWEQCSWWEEARSEARRRWMNDLVDASRATLLKAVQGGDSDKALQILERMDQDFRAPAQRHELTGILGVFAKLSGSEIERLEAMDDEQLLREFERLGPGDGG